MNQLRVELAVLVVVGALFAGVVSTFSCTPTQQAKVARAEVDFCKARAAYKVVAAAAGGALDPAAGSARAKLEAAEDTLCASIPASTDAGVK